MSLWEYIGNLQKDIGNDVKTDAVPAKNGRVPFGVTLDTSKAIPAKTSNRVVQSRFAPTRAITNQDIENRRVDVLKGMSAISGFIGSAVDKVIPESVQKKISKTMEKPLELATAGTRNVRANYAFIRALGDEETAKGMIAGLNLIAGGVAGAIAGASVGGLAGLPFGGVGALPGAAVGALAGFRVGMGISGATQRDIAKSGIVGADSKQAAIYAESGVGQEHYNFGQDTTVQLARITGFKSLGDTSMGIGIISKGLLNLAGEVATDPVLAGASFVGKTAVSTVKGGLVPKTQGLAADFLGRATGIKQIELEDRAEVNIEELKKAGRGEASKYSTLFQFLDNDAATISNHPLLKNNDMGPTAAAILSKKPDVVKSLVLRIGMGDKEAIDELLDNPDYADTAMELNRYESGIAALERDGMMFFRHDNKMIMLGKKYTDADEAQMIKAEYAALAAKDDFLRKAISLEDWLKTDRTVSPFAWIERQRADRAIRATAVSLSGEKLGFNPRKWSEKDMSNSELIHGIRQETNVGKVITSLYKNSAFGTPMQIVSRALDSAPHATIKFNEGIQAATRIRTSLRDSVRYGVLDENQALKVYNEFTAAVNEGVKYDLIEKYAEAVIRNAAIKNGIHESVQDIVVNAYLKNHRLTKSEAISSNNENRAYMVGLDGKAVQDPQLITQLANGAYLPDIPTIAKAFEEYGKKYPAGIKGAKATAYVAKTAVDELQSIWRGGTLMRGGFPINILRDANFRSWADASLFSLYSEMGSSTLEAITNGLNSTKKISALEKDMISPKRTLKKIRSTIDENVRVVKVLEGELEAEGFYKKPKKGAPAVEFPPSVIRLVEYRDKIVATTAELRRQEAAILSNVPTKVIQKDKIFTPGWNFPASLSGQLGDISRQVLEGRENLRGAVASVRELQMDSVRRGSYGLKVMQATDNEPAHLSAWADMLNNHIGIDPLSKKIMEGKMSKPELMNWLREDAQREYISRFGLTVVEKGKAARPLRKDDAEYIYERVNYAVESLASNEEVRKLVLSGKLTPTELVRLYPNVAERPPVAGDVTTAALGTSNIVKRYTVDLQKNVVTWMATVPTSRLNYNHYFAAKYYEKLETLVMSANERGILPNAENKLRYEKIARSYAINEYRNKINAFSKDMNFAGIMNYVIAFFPAVIEQFKAYGRIMVDNPEFPIRLAYAAQIPEYIGNVQEDSYGNKYIEYTMPYTGLKARFGVSWFNPINPTSGSLLSAGPLTTTIANIAAKRIDFAENKLGQFLLPFGVSTNDASAFTPNTWRKVGDLWNAKNRDGEQLNKDKDMISKQYLYDFYAEKNRQPSFSELNELTTRAEDDSFGLSVLRLLSAFALPQQPKMRTAISYYEDRFNEAIKNDPDNGAEDFFKNNPDYFMFAAKLTNSVSGLRSDETAVSLLKRNNFATREIVTAVTDLTALGAVFNDDNYAFSSSADAYLRTQKIPGLDKKYKESEASLENMRSVIVNEGWKDWFKVIQVVSTEMRKPPYNLDPARGYGAEVLKQYKDSYIEQQKIENPMWYDIKENSAGGGDKGPMASVIKAVTIAANTPEMWKDLSQQPRWSAIVEYMNFRYEINDELTRKNIGYDSKAAISVRNKVTLKVWELRNKDVKFGQFYDRYFDGDDFSFVFDYEPPQRSK
jgi:hypothetical protein